MRSIMKNVFFHFVLLVWTVRLLKAISIKYIVDDSTNIVIQSGTGLVKLECPEHCLSTSVQYISVQ